MPNCHSQTSTYADRNLWQKSLVTDAELICAINSNINVSSALRVVGLDVGRTEYFARANKLIETGLAKLNKTEFANLFEDI